MKKWRKNRTTIVITHDLSQIVPDDFVYVMADGIVAEQGFRSDLIKKTPVFGQKYGVFAGMAAEQAIQPLPLKPDNWRSALDEEEVLNSGDAYGIRESDARRFSSRLSSSLRPSSVIYLDILDEYGIGRRASQAENKRDSQQLSRPISIAQKRLSWSPQDLNNRRRGDRTSVLSARPNSLVSGIEKYDAPANLGTAASDKRSQVPPSEKDGISVLPYSYQQNRTLSEHLDTDFNGPDLTIATHQPSSETPKPVKGIFQLIIYFYPTLPHKHLLFFGLLGAVGHGASTPIWAAYLAKLIQIVGDGGRSPDLMKNALIVLSLCAAQGFADFLQEYCLYKGAARWTGSVRRTAYTSVLAQDKAWFDETENSPARLVQTLVKDADDMRVLMGAILGKICVFTTMVGLGIVWAMILKWRLTLIGLALAPVFAIIMVANETIIGKMEIQNKSKREAIGRTFYEVCLLFGI